MLTIANDELDRICEFIYDSCGIRFDSSKAAFVKNRLFARMREVDTPSVSDYLRLLRCDARGAELRQFLDLLTVNETYFYRDLPQLQTFAHKVVPLLLADKMRSGSKRLRIWSAGCSVGCEPYTLGMLLRQAILDFASWKIEIVATDISESALKVARDGLFTNRELKDVPADVRRQFFSPMGEFQQIHADIRSLVRFEYLNLIDESSMARMQDFDVVFCRNVLIYFDDESRQLVMDGFYDALCSRGYIFLGHSESVGKISTSFQLVRLGADIVYTRSN